MRQCFFTCTVGDLQGLRSDGTPRKLPGSSRMHALGRNAATTLEEGLRLYYARFLANRGRLRETVIEAASSA